MELGVVVEGDCHLRAVDRILQIAVERRAERVYHTSPFSLRFAAPSRALASMMHDRPTMMIELIVVNGTPHGYELLAGYEERLADLDVRPHSGKRNTLTPERVGALYPRWDDWLAMHAELNSTGVFASPFGARIGL